MTEPDSTTVPLISQEFIASLSLHRHSFDEEERLSATLDTISAFVESQNSSSYVTVVDNASIDRPER